MRIASTWTVNDDDDGTLKQIERRFDEVRQKICLTSKSRETLLGYLHVLGCIIINPQSRRSR